MNFHMYPERDGIAVLATIDPRRAIDEIEDPGRGIALKRNTAMDLVAALIDFLDDTEGDCDLEDGGDEEPSWGICFNGICELEGGTDDDTGIDDEPHDGELDLGELDPLDAGEQMFATSENVDQSLAENDGGRHLDEMEADYVVDRGDGRVTCHEANEEDNLGGPAIRLSNGTIVNDCEESIGALAIRLPDGTIVNDREGSGMSLDELTDDHGICDGDALSDPAMAFHPLGNHGGRAVALALLGRALA